MLQFVPVKGKKEDYPVIADVIYLDDSTGNSMTSKYKYAVEHYVTEDTWYCFRHDDLTIETPMADVEWFLNNRVDNDVAVCGVMGTLNIEQSLHWWMPFREVNGVGYIKQAVLDPATRKPVEPFRTYEMNDWPGYHKGLASVDGCVMFIHKKLFDAGAQWDEHLPSYHFYDVDISLQALEHGYSVATLPIVCAHISRGDMPPPEIMNPLRQNMFNKWNNKTHGVWPINRYSKFY